MKGQPRDRRSLHHPTRHSKNAVTMAIVTLLVIVGLTSAAIAQGTVLDRRVGPDHLGAPVVWLPESIGSGLFVRRVAWGAQVPLVFEAAPAPQVSGLPIQVDLTNLTV